MKEFRYIFILVATFIVSAIHKPVVAAGSYLTALQRSASDPVIYRTTTPPPTQRYNYNRQSFRNHGGRGGCRTDYSLDYLMLTLQWGPGFCATSPQECKRMENKLFTIHGMWPQYRNADSPAFCCFDNTFDYNIIEPLVPSLNKYWFSYYDKNSRGFWSHEWLKHGTCLRDIKQLQGEQKFFGTTINILKQLPVLDTLVKSGIVPGDKKVYNSRDIQNALRQLTGGKSMKVDCDLEAHQPVPLLKGVNFCFDTSLNFTDCPPSKSRCQRQVMFLN